MSRLVVIPENYLGTTCLPVVIKGGLSVGSMSYSSVAASIADHLSADGSSLATATYPELFAVIGYTFGGAGANFSLPNVTNYFIKYQ